jgi:hypothetical protein
LTLRRPGISQIRRLARLSYERRTNVVLAYTAGDALNAIRRGLGVASTADLEDPIDFALYRRAKELASRFMSALRQYRSPADFDDYAF